ncbi:Golgi transport complex subunit 3 [Friedmanniomyces endolithicus]|uniref:Conserved oligomeric Golgi complex subunit 3 n=1 Tax=Friedmanniomyces endolithicus TaxID=329885 RepID=A0AAN6KS16_9PEZI|nr:Golgi transport complex subunit 3 [Friedmanniomyces endolithicus]KAK0965744.1 Golgi transport complex subunit 3 [Friedmanniomyces endolithicus]KAK0998220.1 Golgi transport complex subunit 3 [Friedmanniomyces endolithicus]KAK1032484.1 Golgi transport complex subunit 3 [Friedmanniomyces endolithicus]
MDDAWFHTLTATPEVAKEESLYKRRASLLQQPVGAKADVAVEAVAEINEAGGTWDGPPNATLSRRVQSYRDFYHAVTAVRRRAQVPRRRRSVGCQEYSIANYDVEREFDADFAALEGRLAEESDRDYQVYQEHLQLASSHLDGILLSTANTLNVLSTLSSSFRTVTVQADAFRQQCESLISEQRRLSTLVDSIEENSRYYAYLEPITRRLNAPGAANLVKGADFAEMLSNLDQCLAYMETHPKHKEAATYRSKYRLLLTRALTLIRHHFTKSLGDIAAEVSKRIQSGQLKNTTHSALLYAKFRVPAPELKALGLEIQKRAVPTPEEVDAGREPEYASLLRELYQSYSATRGRLILPMVNKKMVDLSSTPQHSDVIAFAKASLTYMRGICLDEYELWHEWFETDGALYEFLESLMDPIYDYLRPKVIHEMRLEKLCELCELIQGRYMSLESDDEDDESAIVRSTTSGKLLGRKLDFGILVRPALEDAQTRLVFLALAALREGIENYAPKPEDLDWPKTALSQMNGAKTEPVLSGARNTVPSTPATPIPVNDTDDAASIFSKPLDASETKAEKQQWYPTLRKAIWLLHRIYRLLNSTVFDDLAHRIVHSTIHSHLTATQQITRRKTTQDGQLFLITHLLHLKQQIVAFDIEFSPPEIDFDFSAVTNTFYELRDRGSLWNPASWVRLVGGAVVGGGLLPKVVENMLDAKAELDGRLRTVINDFVSGYANHITAPIDPATIAQAQTQAKTKEASPFDALKAIRTVRGLAETSVPALRAHLAAWLPHDVRTRETLVAAVRDQVVLNYEEFVEAWSEGVGKRVSRKGKAREDEVWGVDLFGEAMEGVFKVSKGVGEGEGDGDGEVSD